MIAIKAGGSVLTSGAARPGFDRRAAARLARALAVLREPFFLVHGTGSFGKPPAARYGYLSGRIAPGGAPVARISSGLLRLHSAFVAELTAAGVPAVSCPGTAWFDLRGGRPRLLAPPRLRDLLRRGLVPVVNSDIFPGPGPGFTVVSSDALLAEAAAALGADLAVFLTGAPGLLAPGGATIPRLARRDLPALARSLPAAPRDVSGGVRAKVLEIARLAAKGIDSLVLDGRRPGELRLARAGKAAGTYIHA